MSATQRSDTVVRTAHWNIRKGTDSGRGGAYDSSQATTRTRPALVAAITALLLEVSQFSAALAEPSRESESPSTQQLIADLHNDGVRGEMDDAVIRLFQDGSEEPTLVLLSAWPHVDRQAREAITAVLWHRPADALTSRDEVIEQKIALPSPTRREGPLLGGTLHGQDCMALRFLGCVLLAFARQAGEYAFLLSELTPHLGRNDIARYHDAPLRSLIELAASSPERVRSLPNDGDEQLRKAAGLALKGAGDGRESLDWESRFWPRLTGLDFRTNAAATSGKDVPR
jgi:hypothetical protein